jgi:NADH-quinone oxidoreductase subunit L
MVIERTLVIEYTPSIVAFPLLGFLLLGLFGARIKSEKAVGVIACSAVGLSFLTSVLVLIGMPGLEREKQTQIVEMFTWISTFTGDAGSLKIAMAYQVDRLSILMTLIVTGVGFLIHVYSVGYMHGDGGFRRFFAYMNLFVFAMLTLVLANNFLFMFLGWEGVGLCSYLLIGFWYERKTAADAAKKAFIVNRIGDLGFILGVLLILTTFGSLDFNVVFNNASLSAPGNPTISWIAFLLFIGAVGKSAQIPLYVWLPDAMAGPTPVSALIHAATMVTAGVYMVARCSILYALAPLVMHIVAVIGVCTAVFAATIAMVQNDIKKVLAYSTISQLGYMFLAMGVAAFSAGIFHLMTHAFFKALLFLGSGAVIHAMKDEQDIQRMGGLKEDLPVTYKTFAVGALALAGIPPLAGFFSKDEILWNAFSGEQGSWLLWLLGVSGAALTAFYAFRLVSLAFLGEKRFNSERLHPHDPQSAMLLPLIILAVLSVAGGFVGIPHASVIERWLDPVFAPAKYKLLATEQEGGLLEYLLTTLSVIVAVGGVFAARWAYQQRSDVREFITKKYSGLYRWLVNKYYIDEAYNAVVVDPVVHLSESFLWKGVDVSAVDGTVEGSAKLVQMLARIVRKVQTGVAQFYALVFVGGILCIVTWLLIG